jgi:DnaJ-class molecular chaperone
MQVTCKSCKGRGKLDITLPLPMKVRCLRCGGTGFVHEHATASSSKEAGWLQMLAAIMEFVQTRVVRRKRKEKQRKRDLQ